MNILSLAETVFLENSECMILSWKRSTNDIDYVLFENPAVIGFIYEFDSVSDLLENWRKVSESTMKAYIGTFRSAGQKAWNVYNIFLTCAGPGKNDLHYLREIEEDLSSTRKIARANIVNLDDLRQALSSLLPFSYIPKLESLNIQEEIRQRAYDIPKDALDEFLSGGDMKVIASMFEVSP